MKTFVRRFSVTAAFAACSTAAMAHPGHAPTDVVAQVASPLSGADHALVFGVVAGLVGMLSWRLTQFVRTRRGLASVRSRR